jgi:LysM repeat protein
LAEKYFFSEAFMVYKSNEYMFNLKSQWRSFMKNDPELQIDDEWSDDSTYSPKRRRVGSGNSKFLQALLGILLVLLFTAVICYFLSKRPTGDKTSTLQSKVTALEQKMAGLETQLAELQGKISSLAPDPALIRRVDGLAQKIEALDKQKQPTAESKANPSPSSIMPVSIEKQYHTVQNGETLYRISKKYGISLEELRKLNHLSADQPLRAGQEILVSPGR